MNAQANVTEQLVKSKSCMSNTSGDSLKGICSESQHGTGNGEEQNPVAEATHFGPRNIKYMLLHVT